MKRKIIPVALLLLAGLSLTAQEKQPSWIGSTVRNILTGVATPKKHFDSTYVFQTKLVWTVALECELLRPGADLYGDFTADASLWDSFHIQDGSLRIGLVERPCHKLGIAAGYGTWRLGYGVQLGKKEGERNTYFGFGLHSASYGAQIRYYRIHPHPTGTIDIGGFPISLTSSLPGELRALTLDGSYAFNRHRFVYNAAYTGRHLQRRSAGSWMVTAKYLRGDFSLDPDDPVVQQFSGTAFRAGTRQFSAGGGYSYNWAILHRDPVDDWNRGLRNLTVNATVLPMVSFVSLVYTEEGDDQTERHKNMPTFTPAVRSAICYSMDRWSFCVEAAYSRYGFRGVEKDYSIPASDQSAHVKARGVFQDLVVKGKVNLHF